MSEERLVGQASVQGTRRGAEAFGAGTRTLGRTGLTVSPVGFGCYRVRDDSPLHRRALTDALTGGVNLIDTSTNYTDGRSEKLVGLTLSSMVQRGELRRDNVVVVSKVGYVQGSNLQRVRQREQPYADMVHYSEDCWHCIEPSFIADQLEESLQRLGVDKLDVLLLHNPEYALADAAHRGMPRADAIAMYEDRLRRAFVALEAAAEADKIAWYGISSNGFVETDDDPRSNSLLRAFQIATQVAGSKHRFAVAQFPMNLFELGAVHRSIEFEGQTITPLRAAVELDIGVLTNRPLNAFAPTTGGQRLLRLAEGQGDPDDPSLAVDDALAAVRKLEGQWATGLGKRLIVSDGEDDAVDLFRWGQELSASVEKIGDLGQWQQVRHEVIAPQLGQASAALLEALQGEVKEQFAAWWTQYGTALHDAFVAIETKLRARRRDMARRIAEAIDPHLPEPWRDMPLSRKAVLGVLCSPVSSVLVGMRQPGYVADILALRERPIRLLSAATGPIDYDALQRSLAEQS